MKTEIKPGDLVICKLDRKFYTVRTVGATHANLTTNEFSSVWLGNLIKIKYTKLLRILFSISKDTIKSMEKSNAKR